MSDSTSTSHVPGSLAQVLVMARYTFQDYLRSRRFAILIVIILLVGGGITAALAYFGAGRFTGGVTGSAATLGFYSGFWGFAPDVVILGGIFFGGDAISAEFQNKTGYFMIPNPIRRSSVYVGKWLAAFIAATIALFIYTAFTVGNAIYYGYGIPSQFTESFFFAWFYLIAVLGFTFFFSSLFKSSAYSFLVTFLLFFLAFPIINVVVSDLANVEPWFLLTYGGNVISDVLMATYPQHVSTITTTGARGAKFSLTTYQPTIPEGLVIIAVYFIVTAIVGLLLFERKEFN